MAVDFQATHPEYQEAEHDYQVLEDVMAGEYRVKLKGADYLPMPNSTDRSASNLARYEQYKQRAIFSNLTQRVARTLIGLGFLRDPEISLPPELEPLRYDATGTGLPLTQLGKLLGLNAIVYGRGGIHLDYPSRAAITDPNRLRPYLVFYKAKEIINWFERGYQLRFVTLRREIESTEGYVVSIAPRWRILEMVGGERADVSAGGYYVSKLYEGTSSRSINVIPVDFNNRRFDHILFYICGAFDNTWSVNGSPMRSVAANDLGIYRNSADAEEISYIAGQPQVFIRGLDNRQVQDNKDKEVLVGTRRGILLGPGGNATMLQANANSAPRELALDKINLIQQLGVQLAVGSTTIQTATEIVAESLIRNSVLTSALQNVSLCLTAALKDACYFVGADPDSAEFKIDTSVEITAEEATAAMSGAITMGNNNNSQGNQT